jgi:PAS domain S-box-containing protein
LYTLPLALSAVHRFKRLLWATTAAAAALTMAAGLWGFDRVALADPVVAMANRGFVVASLVILTAFIHLLINKSGHLAAMEGRYRGLLQAAPDAMLVVNQGGEIVLVNVQAETQFEYRRDELLGQQVTSIIPEGFAERLIADDLRSAEDAISQQIGTGIELTGRRKDGGEFPIELMLSPLDSADGILVTTAVRNITVLAFSRLGRQPLSRQKVRTAAIVEHVLRNVQQRADRRFVGVSVGDLPDVCGDPSLLKQVFVNLIDNAFKYTRTRAEADIEIGSRRTNGEQVLFVRDNGVGFDMQYAGKLFGVFERMHRVDDFEGTGVGRAIVKRIVERHGGRVWAEAAVDRGATFYFTLEAPR